MHDLSERPQLTQSDEAFVRDGLHQVLSVELEQDSPNVFRFRLAPRPDSTGRPESAGTLWGLEAYCSDHLSEGVGVLFCGTEKRWGWSGKIGYLPTDAEWFKLSVELHHLHFVHFDQPYRVGDDKVATVRRRLAHVKYHMLPDPTGIVVRHADWAEMEASMRRFQVGPGRLAVAQSGVRGA